MALRLLASSVAAAVLSIAGAAHADDVTDGASRPPPRLTLAAVGGYAFLHRSASDPSSRDAIVLGAELRVHPTSSPHGFVAGFLHAEGVFVGPVVNIFDAAYSLRVVGGQPLHDASGAVYLELGPTFASVSGASPAPNHSVLGARASVACDGYLGFLLLGVTVGYRGGVPLGGPRDAWEEAFTALARAGLAFDL